MDVMLSGPGGTEGRLITGSAYDVVALATATGSPCPTGRTMVFDALKAPPPVLARRLLVGTGLLLVCSGLIMSGLRLARMLPRSHGWLAPLFVGLGAVGTLTAWFGLRGGRRWPLLILAAVYVPWTVLGLVGDTRRGYWPLVAGEALGLLLIVWAITTITRKAARP